MLTHLFSQYGYLAVFIGSLLEGETVLILAGFGAHQGYLSFPLIILLASGGGMLGDQLCFWLGRCYGQRLLTRFPRLAARAESVNQLVTRYQSSLIIGVRFMYGLRIAGPLVLGMNRDIPSRRFLLCNGIGAILWAGVITSAGYLFGQTLNWLLADIKHYEEWIVALIIAAVLLLLLLRRYHRQRSV